MSNYNVSDDEEEYSDSSLPESEEDRSSLLRIRALNPDVQEKKADKEKRIDLGRKETEAGEGDNDDDDEEGELLTPTVNELRSINEEKKENFEKIVKLWFPKEEAAYVPPWMSTTTDHYFGTNEGKEEEEEEEDEEEGKEFERWIRKCDPHGHLVSKDNLETYRLEKMNLFVEDAYEQCNQFGRVIGEQGMHCLLQNKDYRNGWNDFKRFVEDIFRSDKYDVEFFHAKSTNYWDLTWDGNYDSLSMKKMGYFLLGPSLPVFLGTHDRIKDVSQWNFPCEETWKKTIRNSGYSHVTIVPVDYEMALRSTFPGYDSVEEANGGRESKAGDSPTWIYDPDYDETNARSLDGNPRGGKILMKPASVTGSKNVVVYVDKLEASKEGEERKNDVPLFFRDNAKGLERDKKLCKLYRVIVNFVGQPKTHAWWNTKSKWELAEENLKENTIALSNIQKQLESLDIVKYSKKTDTQWASLEDALDEEKYDSAPVSDRREEKIITKRKRTSEETSTLGQRKKRKTEKKPPKKEEAEESPLVFGVSHKTRQSNDDERNEEFENVESFLSSRIESKERSATKDEAFFIEMDAERCFTLYVSYLFDVVEQKLGSTRNDESKNKPWRIGHFFSNFVIPSGSDIEFKITKSKISSPSDALCGFSNEVIEYSTCYVVKCFLPSENPNGKVLNAFCIQHDRIKLKNIVSFIKVVKFYNKLVDARMDGKYDEISFSNDSFVKHFICMFEFKKYVSSLSDR